MSVEERFDLEQEAYRHESTQARLSGRLKFACCRLCGSQDGMQHVHRDTLTIMKPAQISALAPWYSELGNDAEYLFFTCRSCNQDRIVPDGFMSVMTSILIWASCGPQPDCDPMAPDYAALATKWRAWADELEAVSWYDATLARKVAKYYYGVDSHPATLNALRQLQEKYPDNELLAALAAEPEQVLASLDSRKSAGL